MNNYQTNIFCHGSVEDTSTECLSIFELLKSEKIISFLHSAKYYQIENPIFYNTVIAFHYTCIL